MVYATLGLVLGWVDKALPGLELGRRGETVLAMIGVVLLGVHATVVVLAGMALIENEDQCVGRNALDSAIGTVSEDMKNKNMAGEDTAGEDTAGEDTAGEDMADADAMGEDTMDEDTMKIEDMESKDTEVENTEGEDMEDEDMRDEDMKDEGWE
ncbi:hypothetical protein BGW39_001717 [Mortierella sp. 14UC]|nr:hypothetical protein BGW39_001717 [Mortierella sp. 14UC]